jgi:hypothetical protein
VGGLSPYQSPLSMQKLTWSLSVLTSHEQCCRAETICFVSGSDFQKVSAPAPAPALT